MSNFKFKDLTGMNVGRLKVISKTDKRTKPGVPFYRIEERLSRGWSESELFSEAKQPKKLEYNGELITVSEFAKIANIDRKTMYGRLRIGWTIEKILNTPVQVHHKTASE